MKKHYINLQTGEDTANATQAMEWHRSGAGVQVNTYHNAPHKSGLANVVHVAGAKQKTREDENREACQLVSEEVEAYANGEMYMCPHCHNIIQFPGDVGDKFKCPHCGDVDSPDEWEILGLYDYLEDVLDTEWIIDSNREYKAARFWITLGGPSCWIDTERRTVELRWGGKLYFDLYVKLACD